MLFICPICGLQHGHTSEPASLVAQCKTLPGAIWVRVISDDQFLINNIRVNLSGGPDVKTGKTVSGFAAFNNLEKDTQYSVMLGEEDFPDEYEPPKEPEKTKTVKVKEGSTKVVTFKLQRRAQLTVKFLLKACGPKFPDDLPFKTPPITVKAKTTEGQGSTDSKPTIEGQTVLNLTPAIYTVTPDYSALDDQLFEWTDKPLSVDVAGDDGDPVVFELGRKAKLRVEIVFKHDPDIHLRDDHKEIVDIKLDFLGNDFKPAETLKDQPTKEGVVEFASLSPGKYRITPNYEPHKCRFDYDDEEARSEERRVGKECRSRWSPYH